MHEDFRDFLIALAEVEAEFLLVGGWALALHGHVRGTDDMDVLVRASSDNAELVFAALAAFGAPTDAHGVTAGLFAEEGYGYRMGVKPYLIEVLTRIDGVDFDAAWRDRKHFDLDGRLIPYIGRRSLLANTRASGRPKDLADIAWLEAHDEGEGERE